MTEKERNDYFYVCALISILHEKRKTIEVTS